MVVAFKNSYVDAVVAASIFHYDKLTLDKVKRYLADKGIKTRL